MILNESDNRSPGCDSGSIDRGSIFNIRREKSVSINADKKGANSGRSVRDVTTDSGWGEVI